MTHIVYIYMYIYLTLLNILFSYGMTVSVLELLHLALIESIDAEVITRYSVEYGQIGRITDRADIKSVIYGK